MKSLLNEFKTMVLNGSLLDKKEALQLSTVPLDELCKAADEIREKFCGNQFDLCTIINGKNGKCSENCKYCAQSSFYDTDIKEYPLLKTSAILEQAKYNANRGVPRYSIVTAGKKLSMKEVEQVCESIQEIKKQTDLSVCVSFGLLNEEEFRKIKDAGATRVHNNLESSKKYFPNVCTTHTYEDKIKTIKAARQAGLDVCSGGITIEQDKKMLKELGYQVVKNCE